MKWIVLAARLLTGLAFFVFGLQHFVPFLPMQMPELPDTAKQFMGVLIPTHYMDVVKALEVIGGLLLLTGRLAPLGVVVLMPVAVNILLWDLLIMKQPALGVVFTGLLVVVMLGYRRYFLPFFVPNAKIGG
ncbi:DoxX family membrane protein [Limnoglobus roseus]|uniref:DoxX family membrane protein n=1 Tax=Limnoglobus roseus TaxID=2598579 RepID=A0A5C1A4F1_9BACT|nr:DoxX family membrane protein [Limnoglobus roseus]QEL13193.1 hypothetical protein PX52LOC_00046 [Limnoglobus roseus]